IGLDWGAEPPVLRLFRRTGGKWRYWKEVHGVRKGRQQRLLKHFAEGEGFLSRKTVIVDEFGLNATRDEAKAAMKRVKPELSKLGKALLEAISPKPKALLEAASPKASGLIFMYDSVRKGWLSRIEIGYAEKSDDWNAGQEEQYHFRTHTQMSK